METPWGRLADLDATNRELAFTILSYDKHQLLEGLVVENTFDQILQPLTEAAPTSMQRLDIETIIVDTRRKAARRLALIWTRSLTFPGLGRYLQALERVADVHLIEFRENEFFATKCSAGKRAGEPTPLQDMLALLSGRRPIFQQADLTVRDADRQRTAFWGYLADTYKGDRLWKELVLFRLLVNFGVQPFFRSVWNLDRICLFGDRLWMLEAKHKFPFGKDALRFGINDGELNMMRLMNEAGVSTLYALVVKPKWSKEVGSMYLHSDLRMRSRALIIGKIMDSSAIEAAERTLGGRSPAHTSLTGTCTLSYKYVPADGFCLIGSLADRQEELSRKLFELVRSRDGQKVSDEMIRAQRIQ
ncbi:hypothetical protein ACQQ2N_08730 [Dokdonella sp. MW10]|uniref:hypothetical protein n=1 Tax=Dokdonella sp. MW10 TaxID=2992926 RepID=UPI003F81AB5C